MLWLDEHCEAAVRELLPKQEWSDKDRRTWAMGHAATLRGDLPVFRLPRVCKKTWEFAVVQDTYRVDHRIHGYIDLHCIVECDCIDGDPDSFSEHTELTVCRRQLQIGFEVKPKIESVGEVIRQIRRYQTYAGPMQFAVVSPDGRFAKLLREQGIGFVLAPGSTDSLF